MQRWGTTVAAVALALAGPALGQGTQASFVFPKEIRWGPAPPNLPAGAQAAVLQGDPTKSGAFVVRLMVPGGYKIPPHWHSQDEQLTVISGALYLGMGDHYDPGTARGLPAGGFHYLPAKAHHFAYAKKPTVVQINGNGPFDITYINPADTPRAQPKP
jgi:hypothetical protein